MLSRSLRKVWSRSGGSFGSELCATLNLNRIPAEGRSFFFIFSVEAVVQINLRVHAMFSLCFIFGYSAEGWLVSWFAELGCVGTLEEAASASMYLPFFLAPTLHACQMG